MCFPPGLNGLFILQGAVIGNGCSNTLPDSKSQGAPIIGNNVYIGAGAKLLEVLKLEIM